MTTLTKPNDIRISGDTSEVQEEVRRYLKQENSNPYELDTLLHDAIQHKRADIISFLLSVGVPLAREPCYRATDIKSVAVYDAFVQNGWKINSSLDHYEPPALGFIVGSWELTTWFLAHGADPNARCYFDYTPMSKAVQFAPLETIKFLFERGGDIHHGQLVHHAIERDLDDVTEVLDLLIRRTFRHG